MKLISSFDGSHPIGWRRDDVRNAEKRKGRLRLHHEQPHPTQSTLEKKGAKTTYT